TALLFLLERLAPKSETLIKNFAPARTKSVHGSLSRNVLSGRSLLQCRSSFGNTHGTEGYRGVLITNQYIVLQGIYDLRVALQVSADKKETMPIGKLARRGLALDRLH